MFKRSGKQIKVLVNVLHVINIIIAVLAAVIIGVVMLLEVETPWGFVLGAVIAVVYILLSWLSLLFTHAFGTLVESNEKQEDLLRQLIQLSTDSLGKLNNISKESAGSAASYKAPVNAAPAYKAPVYAAPVSAPPVYAAPVSAPPVSAPPVSAPPVESSYVPAPAAEPSVNASSNCAYCGAKLEEGAKFCTFCGHAQ